MKSVFFRRRGAALLSAMITVALVASFASRALWQQWQNSEIEHAERVRVQAHWLLLGALDWARLILREDALNSSIDHLGEPWAVPLREARLSDFLAANKMDGEYGDVAQTTFLSGQIIDLQSRLNVTNLIDSGHVSQPALKAFDRLFGQLGLPRSELRLLSLQLLAASTAKDNAPLMPSHFEQLGMLGLSPVTLRQLAPYATLLPEVTSVNINTASATVLQACVDGLSAQQAAGIISQRQSAPFNNLSEAQQKTGLAALSQSDVQLSVNTNYFEIQARLRMDEIAVQTSSTVHRTGAKVATLRIVRGVSTMPDLSQ